MQGVSYATVTNIVKRTRGGPKGFIPDEALDRDPALRQDTALKDAGLQQVRAGDLDDGLPRGLLVGAIVKVWLTHLLNWAGELLGR